MILLAGGCTSNTSLDPESAKNGIVIQDQDLISQISSSPASVQINGIEYVLKSSAWRDFMPIVNPPVRLNLNNTLIRTDENSIQSTIEILQQYILKENKIWRPDKSEVRLNESSPNQLNIVSREGPTWEVGSKVDVGLKIKDQETGNIYWLAVPDVEITETH